MEIEARRKQEEEERRKKEEEERIRREKEEADRKLQVGRQTDRHGGRQDSGMTLKHSHRLTDKQDSFLF